MRLSKIALALFAITLTVSALTACLAPTDNGEPKGDGRIFSASTPVSLVSSDEGSEPFVSAEYASFYKYIFDLGVDVTRITDATDASGSEIAFGRTNREASVYAYGIVDGAYTDGDITYVICYKNSTLAVAAADAKSMDIAMERLYGLIVGGALSVDTELCITVDMTADEYTAAQLAERREQEAALWESRWDEVAKTLSAESLSALRGFYDEFCGPEVYEWLAGLYDPETGGFYYADSSRAYSAFLPDLESTYQTYNILRGSGMLSVYSELYGGTGPAIVRLMPDGTAERLLAWVRSMQSAEDGYFYHPQWGEGIGSSRRGRDLDWAINILGWLGEKPLYPTAIDRLGGVSTTAAVSRVIATATPDYLSSEEAFRAWLEDQCLKGGKIFNDSHSVGHEISSLTSQIKAAGLGAVAIEFFDGLQEQVFLEMQAAYEEDPENNPRPTGLWQKEANYTSISGFYKIAIMYSSFGYGMKHLDYVLDSAIECILSETEATNIVYLFNPWASLSNVFAAMKRSNNEAEKRGAGAVYDIEAAHGVVRARCAELVEATVEKLEGFRHGSAYSYYLDGSAAYTQGTWVSMGLAEGDVNATMLSMSSLRSAIFSSLGLDMPALWNSSDLDEFLRLVSEVGEIVKQPNETGVYLDFDDLEIGDGADGVSGDSGVVADPLNAENKVISFTTPAGQSSSAYVMVNHGASFGYAYLEADFMITEGSGTTHQLEFRGSAITYMATLTVNGGFVRVGETTNRNSGAVVDTGIYFPVGEWCTMRIELYTSENGLKVKYYTGEGEGRVCKYISESFYGSDVEGARSANDFSRFGIYSMKTPASTLLLDNVISEMDLTRVFDDSDYIPSNDTEVNYDLEAPNPGVIIGGGIASYAERDGDGVLEIKKGASDATNMIDFLAPTVASEVLVLELDLCVERASSRGVFQIGFGGVGGKAAYLLSLEMVGGKIVIADVSDTSGNPVRGTYDCTLEIGVEYRLRVELVLTEDAEDFEARLLIDSGDGFEEITYEGGEEYSGNYARTEARPTPTASLNGNKISVRPNGSADIEVYLDDILISYE